jgi:hypothetical protein
MTNLEYYARSTNGGGQSKTWRFFAPIDCGLVHAGEYFCNRTISSKPKINWFTADSKGTKGLCIYIREKFNSLPACVTIEIRVVLNTEKRNRNFL